MMVSKLIAYAPDGRFAICVEKLEGLKPQVYLVAIMRGYTQKDVDYATSPVGLINGYGWMYPKSLENGYTKDTLEEFCRKSFEDEKATGLEIPLQDTRYSKFAFEAIQKHLKSTTDKGVDFPVADIVTWDCEDSYTSTNDADVLLDTLECMDIVDEKMYTEIVDVLKYNSLENKF